MAASLGQRASRPLRLCRDCHRWRNGGSRGAFLEALSLMRSITLPLVRARGRALQNCVHTAQGQSYRESIGVKPSGSGCLRARRMLSHWRGLPRRPLANGGAEGLLTLRVQTVLQCAPPCAHQRRSIGKAHGQALPKTFRPCKRPRKRPALRSQLFSTFFSHPLALPSRFCYTCNRQQWAGPSEEARAIPIPLRIERKNE